MDFLVMTLKAGLGIHPCPFFWEEDEMIFLPVLVFQSGTPLLRAGPPGRPLTCLLAVACSTPRPKGCGPAKCGGQGRQL